MFDQESGSASDESTENFYQIFYTYRICSFWLLLQQHFKLCDCFVKCSFGSLSWSLFTTGVQILNLNQITRYLLKQLFTCYNDYLARVIQQTPLGEGTPEITLPQ